MSAVLQEQVVNTNLPPIFDRPIADEPPRQEDIAEVRSIADLQLHQRGQAVLRAFLGVLALHLFAPDQRTHLNPVLDDLKELHEEEQSSEHPITGFAFLTARATLRVAYSVLGATLPPPALAPDGVGGIRIEWARPDRNVRAVIPYSNEQRSYIYYQLGDQSGIDKLSGVQLAERLRACILEQ